jgi:regulator of ribonuclease activity A
MVQLGLEEMFDSSEQTCGDASLSDETITDVVEKTLGTPRRSIWMIIYEVPAFHFAIGGEPKGPLPGGGRPINLQIRCGLRSRHQTQVIIMSSFTSTADLYDQFGESCFSCSQQFRDFGKRLRFAGRIRTVQCSEDNVILKRMLGTSSDGDVLVVDGGGSLNAALIGDAIASLGARNGWSGVVINGAVRDSVVLRKIEFGVKALGTNPRKSKKEGNGKSDLLVSFAGLNFVPDHWIYCDEDGILTSAKKLV